ncbi:hypothetical protein DR092_01040 [Mycoplasma hyorhinis]|uniref:hypothetical protein n=1 Tax=Mesomycoplasma hyorhinis TaxID=2100 RepID=UPI001371769A|nr:hypothetical protein [Mesomycoplasma hyorhinis]MXR09322.1 hypothetical protein [Mesomycoplasma hyorhinis]
MSISAKQKDKIFDNYCKNKTQCLDFAGREIIKDHKKNSQVQEENSDQFPGFWDIDHIIPQDIFDKIDHSKISVIKKYLNSEKNLQPVHRKTNEEKGNNLHFVANNKKWRVVISPYSPNSTKKQKLEIIPFDQKLINKQIDVQSLIKVKETKKNQAQGNQKASKNKKVEIEAFKNLNSSGTLIVSEQNQATLDKPIPTTKSLLTSYKNQFHLLFILIDRDFNFDHLNMIEDLFKLNDLKIQFYFSEQKFSNSDLKFLTILVKHKFNNNNFGTIFESIIEALSFLEKDKLKFSLKTYPIFWSIQAVEIKDLTNFKSNIFAQFYKSQESFLATKNFFTNANLLVSNEIKNSLSLIYNLNLEQWNTDKNAKWFWLKKPY